MKKFLSRFAAPLSTSRLHSIPKNLTAASRLLENHTIFQPLRGSVAPEPFGGSLKTTQFSSRFAAQWLRSRFAAPDGIPDIHGLFAVWFSKPYSWPFRQYSHPSCIFTQNGAHNIYLQINRCCFSRKKTPNSFIPHHTHEFTHENMLKKYSLQKKLWHLFKGATCFFPGSWGEVDFSSKFQS